jgi:hypothetical protein
MRGFRVFFLGFLSAPTCRVPREAGLGQTQTEQSLTSYAPALEGISRHLGPPGRVAGWTGFPHLWTEGWKFLACGGFPYTGQATPPALGGAAPSVRRRNLDQSPGQGAASVLSCHEAGPA